MFSQVTSKLIRHGQMGEEYRRSYLPGVSLSARETDTGDWQCKLWLKWLKGVLIVVCSKGGYHVSFSPLTLPTLLYKEVILQGEVWRWSLLGLKGLNYKTGPLFLESWCEEKFFFKIDSKQLDVPPLNAHLEDLCRFQLLSLNPSFDAQAVPWFPAVSVAERGKCTTTLRQYF